MPWSSSTMSMGVDAKISFNGTRFCHGRFIDRSTVERVQNDDEAICALLDPTLHRVQSGRTIVAFSIITDLTADLLTILLPYMGVTNTAGTTWAAAQALTTMPYIGVDKVGAAHKYGNVRIGRWSIRAQRGSKPVSIQLDCIAATETDDTAGATITYTEGGIGKIFSFTGATFSHAGTAYAIDRIALVCDLKLVPQWNNNIDLTDAIPGGRDTYLATSVPYTPTNKPLYWNNKSSVAGVAIVGGFTNGTDTTTLTMPKAICIPKSPDLMGKMEIRLPMTWQARVDASTNPDTSAFSFNHVDA